MYPRIIKPLKSKSFFLFGARATGKSSWLLDHFPPSPTCRWFNFLDEEVYRQVLLRPQWFVEQIPKDFGPDDWVIADEIQRVPSLLNYVHKLIEEKKIKFALSGSSARKLKRGGANLLAGRALLNTLHPLTYRELGADFDLSSALEFGTLPDLCTTPTVEEKNEILRAYASTYLKEEIKEEQLIRSIEPFVRFLEVAAQTNGQILNYAKIARDSGASEKSIERYFEILRDTFLGFFLDPFHRSARKVQTSKAKFYFFDLGVKRALEGSLTVPVAPRSYAYGKAFEHFFILECLRLNDYLRKDFKFYYIRTKDDVEIDLIVERPGKETLAIEIKSSDQVDLMDFKAAAHLCCDLKIEKLRIASNEKSLRESEQIIVYPWQTLLDEVFD